MECGGHHSIECCLFDSNPTLDSFSKKTETGLAGTAKEDIDKTKEKGEKCYKFCALVLVILNAFFLYARAYNGFVFDSLTYSIGSASRVLSDVRVSVLFIVVLVFVGGNTFIYLSVFEKDKRRKYLSELLRMVIFNVVLIIVLLACLEVIHKIHTLSTIVILAFVASDFLIMNVYNVRVRDRKLQLRRGHSKSSMALVGLVFAVLFVFAFMKSDQYYLEEYISTVPKVDYVEDTITYDDETGIYTITTDKDDFRILQLTDIHLGGSYFSKKYDLMALETCRAVIEEAKPDLIVVTGDLCFATGVVSFSLNNTAAIRQFVEFMRNIGIPWAFTYGNHDTDSYANAGREEIDELFQSVAYKTSKCFLYSYNDMEITGRRNQLIEIRNSDNTLKQAVFLIDSNDYTGKQINDYDYIHDDQVEWYVDELERLESEEGELPKSLLFTHIPLQEYQEAYSLYEEESTEVTHYFGRLGEGFLIGISPSVHDSKMFDEVVRVGSTKAIFCGHDHLNTFSLEYKGVRLTYGMSIDYLTRSIMRKNTYQKGGTIIDVNEEGDIEISQCPYDAIVAAKETLGEKK